MRLKAVVVAAALVAGVPAFAHGAPPRAHDRAAKRAAWAKARDELARHLPLDPATVAATAHLAGAAASDGEDYAYLTDAGDLDGDGAGDLVDVREHLTMDQAGNIHDTVRLEAHRGRDGAALWSASAPEATWVYPVFAPVGLDGKPGVLVVAYDDKGADAQLAFAGAARLTITAYDGKGTLVWAKTVAGAVGVGPTGYTGTGEVGVGGIGQVVPGGGTDVLLQTWTTEDFSDPTYTVYQARSHMQLTVIDGATGVERPFGPGYVSESYELWADVVGDMDKDGTADVAVVSITADKHVLTLVHGATGLPIGTPAGLPEGDYWRLRALPDVTGDGAADLAAVVESWGWVVVDSPSAASAKGAPGTKIALIDAGKLKVAWTKAAERVYAIGNADGKAGSEVVLGSYADHAFGFTAAAYTGSGKRLWSVTRTLSTAGLGEPDDGANYWAATTDVHGDGVADMAFTLFLSHGKRERRDEGVINGRTGRVVRDPAKDLTLTDVPLDGKGSDAFTHSYGGGVTTIAAWRGDKAQRLWQVSYAGGVPYYAFGTHLDKDRCGELVVSGWSPAGFTDVVLSGKNGKPLWGVTRAGDAAGKVVHPAVRSAKQYARTC
ncbi:MAG TPA: hypothetical protein VFQ85_02350 [Mycobacteriales bacterium]|jgi:hypothetical protein|nr:hypothetical protein [Mycobacteriales bacterium]